VPSRAKHANPHLLERAKKQSALRSLSYLVGSVGAPIGILGQSIESQKRSDPRREMLGPVALSHRLTVLWPGPPRGDPEASGTGRTRSATALARAAA